MTDESVIASYPVFKIRRDSHGLDPETAIKSGRAVLEAWSDRVTVRGIYSLVGFTAAADLMFWFVANKTDDVQDLLLDLGKTEFGRMLEPIDSFLGLVRPAEFAKDHLPAFVKGEAPKRYISVYPFVRTPEWYLLAPEERGRLLKEHGEAGREFPDVLANTTSSFGLGDHEWILCFEADSPDRIVELIRRLRATDARRFTKVEVPFYAGIKRELEELAPLF